MQLSEARWFSKLDLRGAYNPVHMAKEEEWKTAFRTRYSHFECKVMPFGLTNALASFQHVINVTLREYLDLVCTAYIDDILVYSKTLTEHRSHIKLILQALKKAGL